MSDTILECPDCGGDGLDDAHNVSRDGDKVVVECQFGSRMARLLDEQLSDGLGELGETDSNAPTLTFDRTETEQPFQASVGDFTVEVDADELVNNFIRGRIREQQSTSTWTSTDG